MSSEDFSQLSMLDLFRVDAENQTQALTAGLLALERNPGASDQLESCMRAAHSLKGAARIVDLAAGVELAHAMEDCFVAAQQGRVTLGRRQIDVLLRGVDLLMSIARAPEVELAQSASQSEQNVASFIGTLTQVLEENGADRLIDGDNRAASEKSPPDPANEPGPALSATSDHKTSDRALRVTAESLNRLLALAGESLVESVWLKPFAESLLKLKRLQYESGKVIGNLHEAMSQQVLDERAQAAVADAQHRILECQQFLSQRLVELEIYDRRSLNLTHRLYEAAVACRMRPFADGMVRFPRMVRDLGRSLGKQVRLECTGAATQVDRDILEKLDAPLVHLLRNAVDHGIELPDGRRAAGKPAEGVVHLEARHSAGMLQIIVSDDGCGIDLDKLRKAVIERNLANAETAARLSDSELLEFLFLPGFSMKDTVTEISGRGVGLDILRDMIKNVRGFVRVSSQPGNGTRFQLQLPLTLSVISSLLVEVGGEPYAFPLSHIDRTLNLPRDQIEALQSHQHFSFEGRQVGVVTAHQVLEDVAPNFPGDELPVIIVSDQHTSYGLVVDRFIGERDLVVHPLDPRLGKIKDISAAALMDDGSPVLIVDVEDMIRSVEKLISSGRLSHVQRGKDGPAEARHKRVLVVDDSLTVRELERKLLSHHGYEVEVAVNGMDGWNAARTGHFDLILTDIDMPRMDGIELVTLVKKDPNLKSIPAMIVSYKDREEDRRRGLEAGADYYLVKGGFHDETLLQAIVDLIGEADS